MKKIPITYAYFKDIDEDNLKMHSNNDEDLQQIGGRAPQIDQNFIINLRDEVANQLYDHERVVSSYWPLG